MENKNNIQELINSLTTELNLNTLKTKDLPNIALYMDQVTTIMDDALAYTKRYPEDKVLTKTMINNYTKAKLLLRPEKKKYSKEHLLNLLLIYNLKNNLSHEDIKILLDQVNHNQDELSQYYDDVINLSQNLINYEKQNIKHLTEEVANFHNEQDLDQQLFMLCYLLIEQANANKLIVTKIIDNYFKK